MIYEIDFFDLTWPLIIAPFIVLYFLKKYIGNNSLLSKNEKAKTMFFIAIVLGAFPAFTLSHHVLVNIQYLMGSYKSTEGHFLSIRDDGRLVSLTMIGRSFKYNLYRSTCLSRTPNIRQGEVIVIKYTGEENNACILSIEKVEEADVEKGV